MSASRALLRSSLLDRIIRVDHAGELGAKRIYQGQMFVLGRSDVGPVIKVSHEFFICCWLVICLTSSL